MIKNRVVQSAENITDEKIRQQLDLITVRTTQTIGEVREISYNLRLYLLENFGLTKAVKSLLNKIANDNFKSVMLSKDVALMNYTAMRDGVCSGKKIPSQVRAMVNYVRRGGKWLEAMYMETPMAQ